MMLHYTVVLAINAASLIANLCDWPLKGEVRLHFSKCWLSVSLSALSLAQVITALFSSDDFECCTCLMDLKGLGAGTDLGRSLQK